MRLLLLSTLATIPLLAVENSFKYEDASGIAQSGHPESYLRVFARGEIYGCPTAYVGDAPIPSQADVRTRWEDGAVASAMVSHKFNIAAKGKTAVNFRDTGAPCNNAGYLTHAQILAIPEADAQIEITANGITHTFNLKTMLAALGSISTDQSSLGAFYTMRGHVVTEVVIRDINPASRQFCKGYEWDWPNDGWKAAASDSTKSNCPEFTLRIYPNTPAPGKFAVKLQRAVLENKWTDRLQTQIYDVTLKIGANLTPYTSTSRAWRHIPKSDWTISSVWLANEPGAVAVDFNFPYMIHSRVLPNYGTVKASYQALSTELGIYYTSRVTNGTPVKVPAWSDHPTHAYLWQKAMGTAGGRKDMGLMNQAPVSFLYLMGDPSVSAANRIDLFYKVIIALAEAGAGLPVDYREHLTDRCYTRPDGDLRGKYFDPTCSMNAAGRPISLEARPSVYTNIGGTAGADEDDAVAAITAPEDRITYVAPYKSFASTAGSFTLRSDMHGMRNGQKIKIRYGPGGISGQATIYYVVNGDQNTFGLSLTSGGAAIVATSSVGNARAYAWDAQVPLSASTSATNYWTWNGSTGAGHWYQFFYPAYLLTGDLYFLEKMQFHAVFGPGNVRPEIPTVSWSTKRNYADGLLSYTANQRASAWVVAAIFNAMFFSLDGSPGRMFYEKNFRNQIALREGIRGLTAAEGGKFQNDPHRGRIWTMGRTIMANNLIVTPANFVHDTLGLPAPSALFEGLTDKAAYFMSSFMEFYIRVAWGHFADLYPDAVPITKELAKTARTEAVHNPIFIAAEYHHATIADGALNRLIPVAEREQYLTKTCNLHDAITSTETSIQCDLPFWFNAQTGRTLQVDAERMRLVSYSGQSPTSGLVRLNLQRGYQGTVAVPHSAGAGVTQIYDNWGWPNPDPVHAAPCLFAASVGATEHHLNDGLAGWAALQANPTGCKFDITQGWNIEPRIMTGVATAPTNLRNQVQ